MAETNDAQRLLNLLEEELIKESNMYSRGRRDSILVSFDIAKARALRRFGVLL